MSLHVSYKLRITSDKLLLFYPDTGIHCNHMFLRSQKRINIHFFNLCRKAEQGRKTDYNFSKFIFIHPLLSTCPLYDFYKPSANESLNKPLHKKAGANPEETSFSTSTKIPPQAAQDHMPELLLILRTNEKFRTSQHWLYHDAFASAILHHTVKTPKTNVAHS